MSNKAGYTQSILKDVLTAGGIPPAGVWWNDPTMQKCFATVKAAEPNATINNPVTATASTPVTWTAPETACTQVALFADIVKAAGKTLNDADVCQGWHLTDPCVASGRWRHLQLLGGHDDGDGPVFVYTWNPTKDVLALKTTVG